MKKTLLGHSIKLAIALLVLCFSNANAQLSITTANVATTQNFDALATSGTTNAQSGGIFANGWSFLESGTNGNTTYAGGTGSDTAGNTYSFGVAATNPVTDRAFGMLQSGSLTSILGFKFTNNTGSTVTSLVIGYTGELWRLSAAADNIAFSYQAGNVALNASGYTTVAGLAFTTPTTGAGAASDGNLAGRRTVISPVTISGLNIPNGTTYTLRWVDASGSSSAGMAIDDFSITLVSPPSVVTTAATAISTTGATLNGTINPSGQTIDASFEYGLTTSYGSTVSSTTGLTGTSATAVSGVIASGLSVNTLYNFRAVGTVDATIYNGNNLTFYTLANQPVAPTVGNATTSSLDVTINADGNPVGTLYAIHETTTDSYVHADGSLGAIAWLAAGTYSVTNLDDNTLYTFEVKAKNGADVETLFSTSASGTTLENLTANLSLESGLAGFGQVCINTTANDSFSFDGANLNGTDLVITGPTGYTFSLTQNGTYVTSLNVPAGATVNDQIVWVMFSPTVVQSYNGNIQINGGGLPAAFEVSATGSGINTMVDVTTGIASGTTSIQTTVSGSLVEGCTALSAYGIEYSTTNNFPVGTGTQVAASNLSAGGFSSVLTGLAANTTYYFRAYATDGLGTDYGNQASLVTAGLSAPDATDATAITYESFTANWTTVPGATSYALDVKTDPFLPAPVIKPWINEFHYDDASTDANEFVEIIVPDAYTGTALTLTFYNGNGGATYGTAYTLNDMVLGQDTTDYNVYSITIPQVTGIQNGNPDGFSLSDNSGLIQFLSYGGTFAATNGPALGITSTSVGVVENGGNEGSSIHLTGSGDQYEDFVWSVSAATDSNTKGNTNTGQTISAVPAGGVYIIEDLNVGNLTSYQVNGLSPETDYYYRVRAVSANSTSGNSDIISVTTLEAPPTFGAISQVVAVVCEGSEATFNVTGLLPDTTSTLTFNINGGTPVNVNVLANASGFGSFDYVLVAANSGQVLTVTSVDRADAPGNPLTVTTNNTVTLSVNAYVTYYRDFDNDTFGNPLDTIASCDGAPAGYVLNNTDCNDNDNTANTVYPYYVDSDGDGYGSTTVANVCAANPNVAPSGHSTNDDDCNDNAAAAHPGATEIGYNLMDDDCDGFTDEGFPPKVTSVQSAMCNSTLPAIDSQIVASLVAGAQGYRWRVTTLTGPNMGLVQELATPLRVMKLTQLPVYAFATQYKIEIAVYFAGFLQPYSPSSCNVTTPAATTQLSVCGQALTQMTNSIYANIVSFATGYRFRITDPINGANTQVIERQIREFKMSMITDFYVQYNKMYNVEVSAKNTDGTWLPYGAVCSVTTPAFPTTSLQDSQCEDYLVPTNSTQIYAISHPSAIAYVFQITGPGIVTPLEVTKTLRAFTLNDFPGLIAGATYNVRVRLVFNFADPAGPFGKTCTIVTPGAARVTSPKSSFDVIAYPNPFAGSFTIAMAGGSAEDVNVKVYDMTGRLLENAIVKASQLETFQAGASYPSGVYNVIVTQGEHAKTVRLIKR
jgi:hypothetical protein